MGEDICGWELVLKALCRFIRVGRKCSYIDECSHPLVRTRRSDDRAAVRVPNQDYGTADPLQSPSHVGDILGVRIESVLRGDHLMSLGEKGRDEFAEARAVCPEAMDEDDAGFALICHDFAPFVQIGRGLSLAFLKRDEAKVTEQVGTERLGCLGRGHPSLATTLIRGDRGAAALIVSMRDPALHPISRQEFTAQSTAKK